MKVESMHQYPLTGAQAVTKPGFAVGADGIVDDRRFVLYDSLVDTEVGKKRISQKQLSELATIGARMVGDNLRIVFDTGVIDLSAEPREEADVVIDEFDDPTPAADMGDEIAALFSERFKRPGLRLAQKVISWSWPTIEEASDRANAPLHIVSKATIQELQRRGGLDIDGRRLRPSIVVNGADLEPFEELSWLDRTLRVGEVTLVVNRVTPRCKVTGHDQVTGEDKKDLPKLYPDLPKGPSNKPVIGVYAYALVRQGETRSIRRDDPIILDR